jgi:outer membrane protein OmpA-like peptidoglycan-associated protein
MKIIKTFLGILILSHSVFAQNAPIKVSVTDFKKSPLQGEQILFVNSINNKTYNGVSDSEGHFNLSLPGGFKYLIKIKSVGEATDYSSFDIPSISNDQLYGESNVEIMIEQPKIFTLKNVLFDTGKSSLKSSSFKELDELVYLLKNKPNINIEIAGHTDNIGNSVDNMNLSLKRAESVLLYLIKKGVNKDRLKAQGYGDTQPVASNDNQSDRKLNRRTEIRML